MHLGHKAKGGVTRPLEKWHQQKGCCTHHAQPNEPDEVLPCPLPQLIKVKPVGVNVAPTGINVVPTLISVSPKVSIGYPATPAAKKAATASTAKTATTAGATAGATTGSVGAQGSGR